MTKKVLSLLLLVLLLASFKPKSKSCHNDLALEFRPPLMGWASWNNYSVNINE